MSFNLRSTLSSALLFTLLLGWVAGAVLAAPPVPSQPTATCDATVAGMCYVNGAFDLSSLSWGAHHYEFCRSNDTTGWGGCDYVFTTYSGPTVTVVGSHLPSNGYRRAYYAKACDTANSCTDWGASPATYVQMDTSGPAAPGPTMASCAYTFSDNCWVTGSFTISVTPATDSGSGVERYRVCRSLDSPGSWSGCELDMTWYGGTSFQVSGSDLPSDGFRRSYRFLGIDYVGNQGAWSSALYVRVDRHDPTVSADNASPDWFNSRSATISAADDTNGAASNSGLSQVRYRWNVPHNGSCSTGTATANSAVLTVPQGDNHLYLCAKDNTGRVSFWDGGPYRVFAATCPVANQVTPRACDGSLAATPAKGIHAKRLGDFELHQKLSESLDLYYLESIDRAKLRRELDATGRLTLLVDGVSRQLVLEPRNLRAPGFKEVMVTAEGEVELSASELSASAVDTFKGTIAGFPDSKARLLVSPELVMGYVEIDGQRFFVDPAYKLAAGGGADRIVIYQETDLQPEPGVSCVLTELERHTASLSSENPSSEGQSLEDLSPEDLFDALPLAGYETFDFASGAEKSAQEIREIEIATDADFEYWSIHGSATNTYIRGVLNMVNGFYEDVGLVFVVTSQRFFTTQNDPYETCQVFGQWCELWREWELYRQGVQRDVVHLFSGKELWWDQGSGEHRVRGASKWPDPETPEHLGTVCDLENAYVLSTPYREVGLVSHEIGHALNAVHRDSGSSTCGNALCPDFDCSLSSCGIGCEQPGGGPIMCNSIQDPTTGFHADSIAEITAYVNSSGSCLNRAPQAVNDSLTTPRDTGLWISRGLILGNDSDPDGDLLWLLEHDLETSQGGSNDIGEPHGFNYTPPAGFVGTDTFTYTIGDRPSGGLTDTAMVTVEVTPGTGSSVVAPWQENANGALTTNINWNYAMGYHFTPQVGGQVVELGGFFNGTKTVKLFNKSTGALLAQATVSAANAWGYTPISPVNVQAGTTYTVAVYLAGSGGSYRTGVSTFPRVYGPIRIDSSTYVSTGSNPGARPTNNITTRMYGQADIKFVPSP